MSSLCLPPGYWLSDFHNIIIHIISELTLKLMTLGSCLTASYRLLPARLELKVSQLHRLRLDDSSPGKSLYFHCPPIFSTSTRYEEIIGLRWSKAPRPRVNAYQRFTPSLGGNFDYGFLQISHWHTQTDVIPPRAANRRFFRHPCLRLHVPFSQRPWLDLNQLAK